MLFVISNLREKGRRFAILNGRRHYVVPMTMMVEGVHAGSQGALYYPAELIKKNNRVWNGRPIVENHPESRAAQFTVLNERYMGLVLNTRSTKVDGKVRWNAEAWFDIEVLNSRNPNLWYKIQNGDKVEVSTGLDEAEIDLTPGEFDGEKYIGTVKNFTADHLAVLPDSEGACSVSKGCGIVTNEGTTLTVNELSYNDRREELEALVRKLTPDETVWVVDFYNDFLVYSRNHVDYYKIGYSLDDDDAALVGIPEKVERRITYVPANPLKNEGDTAVCTKADLVTKVINSAGNPYAEGDRDYLTKMEEARLTELAAWKAPVENAFPPAKKDDEEADTADKKKGKKPVANEQEIDPNDLNAWLKTVPAGVAQIVNSAIRTEANQKAELVATVLTNENCPFQKEYLETRSVEELQGMAALTKQAIANAQQENQPRSRVLNFSGAQGGGFGVNNGKADVDDAPPMPIRPTFGKTA